MEHVTNFIHFVATLLIALLAGLFYSYSCSVNIGLRHLSDTEYLRAMQQINRAILNLWFFASFIGSLIVLPVCAWLLYKNGQSQSLHYALAAAVMYSVGVFGVTILGNVPLNDALDKFSIASGTLSQIKMQRDGFEAPWNRLHFIRTLASILSLVCMLISIFKR